MLQHVHHIKTPRNGCYYCWTQSIHIKRKFNRMLVGGWVSVHVLTKTHTKRWVYWDSGRVRMESAIAPSPSYVYSSSRWITAGKRSWLQRRPLSSRLPPSPLPVPILSQYLHQDIETAQSQWPMIIYAPYPLHTTPCSNAFRWRRHQNLSPTRIGVKLAQTRVRRAPHV